MPAYITVTGLVLRTVNYKDYHRLVTIFTKELGVITATAHGCRSVTNKNHAAAQIMVYGDFTLSRKGGNYSFVEADLKDVYSHLRTDIDGYGYGMLLLEEAASLATENAPQPALWTLTLNALHLMNRIAGEKAEQTDKPCRSFGLVKSVYELRAAFISGFCPDLTVCGSCGKLSAGVPLWLDVGEGMLLCDTCKKAAEEEAVPGEALPPRYPVSDGVLTVLRYLVTAEPKRVFSFTVDAQTEKDLYALAEAYLMYHSEKTYRCLSFFHEILPPDYE